MSEKQERQRRILDVIASRAIGTQRALSEALRVAGIFTTQSTLSKDLKQLGIVKSPDNAGGFRYQAPADGSAPYGSGSDLLARELRDFVVETDGAGAYAGVEDDYRDTRKACAKPSTGAGWSEVVGTIAGENTIFILCQSVDKREVLRERVLEIFSMTSPEDSRGSEHRHFWRYRDGRPGDRTRTGASRPCGNRLSAEFQPPAGDRGRVRPGIPGDKRPGIHAVRAPGA